MKHRVSHLLPWFLMIVLGIFSVAHAAEPKGNVVSNPSLESLDHLGWSGSVVVTERRATQPHSGKYCLYIADQSESWGQANLDPFPIEKAKQYHAQLWVRCAADFDMGNEVYPGGVTVDMQFFDARGEYLGSQAIGSTESTEWVLLGGTVSAPGAAVTASLRVVPTSLSEKTSMETIARAMAACYVDDLYIAPLSVARKNGVLEVVPATRRKSKAQSKAGQLDDSLVVHYRFDENPGETAIDLSGHGNDGTLVDIEYLEQLEGRRGVLHFNGDTSYIDCGSDDSIQFAGDRSFEMWVRFNTEQNVVNSDWPLLYGQYPPDQFVFNMPYRHSISVWYRGLENPSENTWVSVATDLIGADQRWAHIAVVVEYPRCRFYKNGKLYHDGYMPFAGVRTGTGDGHHQHIGGGSDSTYGAPIDLTEFRLYNRALTAEEIAAHAQGQEIAPPRDVELAVEPNWYDKVVTLRLVGKGDDFSGQSAQFSMQPIAGGTAVLEQADIAETLPGSRRYVASVEVPITDLVLGKYRVSAQILGTNLGTTTTFELDKSAWIHSQAGISDKVLAPWTPVTTKQENGGAIEVGVWGRDYHFDATPFVEQIEVHDKPILASPIALTGRVDGEAINWQGEAKKLTSASDTAATLEQKLTSAGVQLRVHSTLEYDGFTTIECELEATRDVSLDELTLEIQMLREFAKFCGGDYVLPKDPNIAMSAMYRGAVKDDLSFRFGPTVWLGDEKGGLSWQAESDQDWHYADTQKAIEILPRGETTSFLAHFVDVPTKLAAGQKLRYKFALQATPLKPIYRDAWDMRIARSEPYGADLVLPDKTIDGKPALQYIADLGIRNLFINVNDEFPWPMFKRQSFRDKYKRLCDTAHEAGVSLYGYSIHARVPVVRPEFDIYGSDMLLRPARQYMTPAGPPERPGTLCWQPDWMPLPQGSADFCQNSDALQDAYIHALNERVTTFGDDGVYLDGSYVTEPCINHEHGCGYTDESGNVHPTYPVFAARQFMKRIYTVVHEANPEGIVDLHSSFFFNVSGIAYADVIWTGEQWYEYRHTGVDYIAGTLTLDMFRTEFTGWTLGVPAETLCYRLGSPMNVAATGLLHDISPRISTNGYNTLTKRTDSYYSLVPEMWKLRDAFGIKEAEKLFYFENSDYVTLSPDKCHATLFKHPANGVLALVSNLSPEAQDVTVSFNLDMLGLSDRTFEVVDPLGMKEVKAGESGTVTVPLGSEEWVYVWLRPTSE